MAERTNEKQIFISVKLPELLTKVKDLKAEGYRFVQACAIVMDENIFEIVYSFDKDHELTNLRLTISPGDEVESISNEYWPAFIYENEMHDLFDIKFTHMALDYEGKFFKVAEPAPWNPNK